MEGKDSKHNRFIDVITISDNVLKWRLIVATYTTAALVRKTVENIDTSLLDADIDAFIEESEGILNCIMERSFISTFDATKHGILRAAANKWAAICCVVFNPSAFESASEWFQIVDVFWDQWNSLVERLEDNTLVRYLESL